MRRRDFMGLLGGVAGLASTGANAGILFKGEKRLPLLVGGSSTMLHFTRALAESFTKANPQVEAVVEGGGSLPGLVAMKRGAIDLAAMSTDLTVAQDEPFICNYLVARDCLGVAVNPANPLSSLDADQVARIFTGSLRNWREVGGPDLPIVRFVRPPQATTQVAAEGMILDGGELAEEVTVVEDSEQMTAAIQSQPGAIGYLSLRRFSPRVKILAVNGVQARHDTILSGRYAFIRSFYYVLRNDSPPAAQAFLTFAIGPKGKEILAGLDVVPAF